MGIPKPQHTSVNPIGIALIESKQLQEPWFELDKSMQSSDIQYFELKFKYKHLDMDILKCQLLLHVWWQGIAYPREGEWTGLNWTGQPGPVYCSPRYQTTHHIWARKPTLHVWPAQSTSLKCLYVFGIL